MQHLRRTLLECDCPLPLSYAESSEGLWSLDNPTWLPEHRIDPWTHPAAKNIPKGQARDYHFYSELEDHYAPIWHWKTQKISDRMIFHGYNPTFEIIDNSSIIHIHMLLPIYLRYVRDIDTQTHYLFEEIFDSWRPYVGAMLAQTIEN